VRSDPGRLTLQPCGVSSPAAFNAAAISCLLFAVYQPRDRPRMPAGGCSIAVRRCMPAPKLPACRTPACLWAVPMSALPPRRA